MFISHSFVNATSSLSSSKCRQLHAKTALAAHHDEGHLKLIFLIDVITPKMARRQALPFNMSQVGLTINASMMGPEREATNSAVAGTSSFPVFKLILQQDDTWNCAGNRSRHRLPDGFTVVIYDLPSQKSQLEEVQAYIIQ